MDNADFIFDIDPDSLQIQDNLFEHYWTPVAGVGVAQSVGPRQQG